MKNHTDKKTYRRLYRLFDGVTPLKQDCGALCGKACCGGDAADGMLLFPCEETALQVRENGGRRFALCPGVCDRAGRPLACRIFPLFPVPDEKGRVRVVNDLRGARLCPLVRQYENVRFSPRFRRRVRKAGRILSRDPDCRAFLREIGEELAELEALHTAIKR